MSKKENNPSEEFINNLEIKLPTSLDEGRISSRSCDSHHTSSSKESLVSDCSYKIETVSDRRLNCHSKEFHPNAKKPDIPRLNRKHQNSGNLPQINQPYMDYGQTCGVGFVRPQIQAWPYAGQLLQQVNNGWSYHKSIPENIAWPPNQNSAFTLINNIPVINRNMTNEVNVTAPEFIPRFNTEQQPKNLNKVEFPQEPINLRKSATLIKENENLLVMMSHIENQDEFYVHFVNQSNKYLDKLYNEMFAYYSTREKIEFGSWREARSKLGKFCACKWPQDNHWYRAEVLDWTVGDNLVKVWFVDHGNKEYLPLTCLQPLTKTFEKLSICSQACHLAEVYPVIKGQPWSEKAVDFFKSKVEVDDSRVYSITVVRSNAKSVKENSFSVLLYEGRATDSSKSINDLLVEKGFAWSRSLLVESDSTISSENYHSMDDLSAKSTSSVPALNCDLPARTFETGGNSKRSLLSPQSHQLVQTSSILRDGPELDEGFEHWDPLREDYESVRNNPALDTDNACVAVSGYSARDEARICKFYARDGFCFKTVCYKEHSMPNPDGITTDKEEVYLGAFSQLELPKPGETVRLRITYVFDINLFYAQIEEKKAVAVDDEFDDDAETLTSLEKYINSPENIRQMRGLTVPPSPGEMVLAREVDEERGTECWFRARVITSSDNNPDDDRPEIMYVDYGSTCTVSERDLRKMDKRYLHLPFQAIECSLANVTPLRNESDNLKRGVELLQEILLGQVLTAKVYESINEDSFQQMEVILESKEFGDIGELLIAYGCATEQPLDWHKATAGNKPVFYPG